MDFENIYQRRKTLGSRIKKLESMEEKLCAWAMFTPLYWRIESLKRKIINQTYIAAERYGCRE